MTLKGNNSRNPHLFLVRKYIILYPFFIALGKHFQCYIKFLNWSWFDSQIPFQMVGSHFDTFCPNLSNLHNFQKKFPSLLAMQAHFIIVILKPF